MSYDTLGLLTIPVSAGEALSTFQDKTVLGLMDFISWYIKYTVDDKLAVLPPTSSDAVPTANRFPWDPSTTFVQNAFPAIYMWQAEAGQLEEDSTVYYKRSRKIGLFYVFNELVSPGGLMPRHGLIPAVDAAVHLAIATGRHPSYGYNGDTPGTPIWRSLSLRDVRLRGTKLESVASIPDVDARSTAGQGHVIRSYPALRGEIEVVERIYVGVQDADTADPADMNTDATMTVFVGPNPSDAVEFNTYVLPGDGVEVE